jgi:PIN domain nuclease of toxin-antitoxin system
MKILLDTCTFLWIILKDPKLSDKAVQLFTDPHNEIYLSVISIWEIILKYRLGKLPLPGDPKFYLPEQRKKHQIASLDLEEKAILQLSHLPDIHNDPFDRILICQSINHGLTLLTSDEVIHKYPVKSVW